MVDRPPVDTGSGADRYTFPAVPGSVPIIRHKLDRVLDALEFSIARAADIRLALTEACTNTVQHAYPGSSPPGEIVIAFEATSEALTVSVIDAGGGIDETSPQPGLGAGLPIIQALVDAVSIENLEPGTRVRMTFQR